MTSQNIPMFIKNNSEELQDFLTDLKNWEKDIKMEDLKLTENKGSKLKEIPPIRSRNIKNKAAIEMKKKSEKNGKKIQSSRISSYDYDAWEKFDDKELESESEGESSEQEEKTSAIGKSNKPNIQDKQVYNDGSSESESKMERAEKLKQEGNLYYAQGKFTDAVAKYTQGIGLNPSNAFLPANRAMTYLKLKKYKAAENDCTKALSLDPNYLKAYLRRATARVHLLNISGAIEDYEKVLKLEPWNKDAKRELEILNKESLFAAKVPPLEEATTILRQNSQVKKMKIEEIDSNESQIENAAKVHQISKPKPIHLQSTKPLIHVQVVEVSSREKLKDLLNVTKRSNESENILPKKKSCSVEKIEAHKPALPKPPRTSHQFAQDWQKISNCYDLKSLYLKSIPVSFFDGTEIEVDLLLEIIGELVTDKFDSVVAGSIMAALMTTRGFFLNISFLDTEQKKGMEKVLQKVENCNSIKEKIPKIRDCL